MAAGGMLVVRPHGAAATDLAPGLDADGQLIAEPSDGSVLVVRARRIVIASPTRPRGADVATAVTRTEVRVTESRITVRCPAWNKPLARRVAVGLGLFQLVAAVMNAVASARARRRRKGLVLCGQVRLPSLAAVGWSPSRRPTTAGTVRLVVDADGETWFVDLELARGERPDELVAEVVRRAVRTRLAHCPLGPYDLAALDAVPSGAVERPPHGRFAQRWLPFWWPAGEPVTAEGVRRRGTRAHTPTGQLEEGAG